MEILIIEHFVFLVFASIHRLSPLLLLREKLDFYNKCLNLWTVKCSIGKRAVILRGGRTADSFAITIFHHRNIPTRALIHSTLHSTTSEGAAAENFFLKPLCQIFSIFSAFLLSLKILATKFLLISQIVIFWCLLCCLTCVWYQKRVE